ncbi:MAG: putative lipid II flippase FtsW [Calditrichia bacterium]|nr:putative lipid II flippase FtsW [Calditrichia bacterium]
MAKRKNDGILVGAVTVLLAFGMIMVFSASAAVANENYGSPLYFFVKQILWGFVCFIAIFVFSRYDYNNFAKKGIPIAGVIIAIALLIAVLMWGNVINNARRWFVFGFISFQPSEMAKLIAIIYFADIFSRKSGQLRDWKQGLLPHAIIFLLILIPIYLEPDLSTTLMIVLIISTMAFLSNIRFKHVLASTILLVPAILLKASLTSVQNSRISDWITNLSNPLGSSYQIRQSLIGLGRGGIAGTGLGASKQKYHFLPESHTDFVFSIIGEEFGFIGTTIILILFLVILWRGIAIARRAKNPFGQFLAVGLTMSLVLYALINAGVVTMLLPTTGLPMPFLSYGGSSLLFVGVTVGILINISKQAHLKSFEERIADIREKQHDLRHTLIMSK